MGTMLRHITFTLADFLARLQVEVIKKSEDKSIIVYKEKGLIVIALNIDQEEEPLFNYLI